MIVNLNTQGPWLQVIGVSSTSPYITESQNPMQGVLRYMSGRLEVCNGAHWISISEHASFGLSLQANDALEWVQKKMMEEAALSRLAEQYPAVADAVNTVKLAEEKLQVVVTLTQENT